MKHDISVSSPDAEQNIIFENKKYCVRARLRNLARLLLLSAFTVLTPSLSLSNESSVECEEEVGSTIKSMFREKESRNEIFISSDIVIISNDTFYENIILNDSRWYYFFKKTYGFNSSIYKFNNSPDMLTEFYKNGSIAFFSDKNEFLSFRRALEGRFTLETIHESKYCQTESIDLDNYNGRSIISWINIDERYNLEKANECYWESILLTAGYENIFNVEFSVLKKTFDNFQEDLSLTFHGKIVSLQSITKSEKAVLLSKENVEHRLRDWCVSFR